MRITDPYFLIVFISAFLLFLTSCSANKKSITNEYGLEVVERLKEYKTIIHTSPVKKLVLLSNYLKPFASNIYYSTPNNFTNQILYQHHQLYINIEAAEKLLKVQDSLNKAGYNLLIFDSYRPYSVTKKMWEIVPDDRYAANPARGSGHNRGIAIDLSLINNMTGKPIEMPGGYDDFSDTAHHNFMKLPNTVIENRQFLKSVMEYFGFVALSTEWWHYSLPNPKNYPIYDLTFKQLRKAGIE